MQFASLLFLASTAFAAPTALSTLEGRATQQCGQYQSQSSGNYVLATNGWGETLGTGTTGSQCSEINSLTGTTLAWDTTWTWSGNNNQVKSYTNVEQSSYAKKQLSAYKSMPTTWKWTYTGTSLRANVAYDTFVGPSAGSTTFEVMVWLAALGGVSPLSANGYPFTPIASPVIAGTQFDLAYGLNGNVKVYSFVARGAGGATSFSGDFLDFYKYLATNYASNGFSLSLYLNTFQAGTEVFTGSNAKLTTTAYSVALN